MSDKLLKHFMYCIERLMIYGSKNIQSMELRCSKHKHPNFGVLGMNLHPVSSQPGFDYSIQPIFGISKMWVS